MKELFFSMHSAPAYSLATVPKIKLFHSGGCQRVMGSSAAAKGLSVKRRPRAVEWCPVRTQVMET